MTPKKKNPVLRTRLPTLPPAARSRIALGLTAAAALGRFELQQCAQCGSVQYPPREACHLCLSTRLKWKEQSGQAELLAATVLHHSNDLFFRERLPWRLGLAKLACGPTVVAHLHADVPPAPTRLRVAARLDRAGQAVLVGLPDKEYVNMTAYSKIVENEGRLSGLAAYHAARPPHSEGLAVFIASYLAAETALPNINLLHLSSKKALQAALQMAALFPHIDFRREVTIGHLMLDTDASAGVLAKVNPPIRPREDVEYLWEKLAEGAVDWVVSDHACCRHETKAAKNAFGNIWLAKSGFGGTEYLLPALISEGSRRGLSYNRIAALTSANPARRFGANSKGDIAEGLDADLALVDPRETWTVRAAESESTQGYTPFEGLELSARVKATFLRGELVCENGRVLGPPRGRYLHRPTA